MIEMNSIEAIKQTLLAGIGITLIPDIAIRKEVEKGALAKVGFVDELETGILMIRYLDKWCHPAVEAFMDTARRLVKETS